MDRKLIKSRPWPLYDWRRVEKSWRCIVALALFQVVIIFLFLHDSSNISLSLNELKHHFNNVSMKKYIFYGAAADTEYKLKNYDMRHPPDYILRDDLRSYFVDLGNNITCFTEGTNIEETKKSGGDTCVCQKYFYGRDCGIPEAAWFTLYSGIYPNTALKKRPIPRRIINGFPVNHEFAMFEARMYEISSVVDVFMIAESNYTASGDPKKMHFLQKFREGYMAKYQDKIVYIKLDYFSKQEGQDGWFADSYIRTYMGWKGIPLLKGLRDDDLFILSDADELPSKEIVAFLKVYDGYPEPVGFGMRWNMYNHQWLRVNESGVELTTVVYSATTIGFLRDALQNDVFNIRKLQFWKDQNLTSLTNSSKVYKVNDWVAGNLGHYAGWHCSWCFSPENIVVKLDSAQRNDTPRWGDSPAKKNLTYIKSLLWNGSWFDDVGAFAAVTNLQDRFFAPPYFLKHPEDYRSILYHPGHPLNLNKPWKPS